MSLIQNLYKDLDNLKSKKSDKPIQQWEIPSTVDRPRFEPEEQGNLYDLVTMAGKGYVEDITWGASTLVDSPIKTGSWQDMNVMERVGYGLGTFGALMTPGIGPFHILGKGGRKIASELVQESTKQLVKKETDELYGLLNRLGTDKKLKTVGDTAERTDVSTSTATEIVNTIESISRNTGKTVDEIIRPASKEIRDKVTDMISDEKSEFFQSISRHSLGGSAAIQANSHLNQTIKGVVKTAFEDAGVTNISSRAINDIANSFSRNVASGKHLNEIESWIHHGLAGEAPSWIRNKLSKYTGMAAQETLYMAIHGAIAGQIKAIGNDEEFSVGHTLAHSGKMGLMFPLIRLIPFGGHDKVMNGVKVLRDRWRSTNYKELAKKHGDEKFRKFAAIQFKNGANGERPFLANTVFKNGKTGSEIYEEMFRKTNGKYTMDKDELVDLLNESRQYITGPKFKEWLGAYSWDYAKSIPRMVIGGLAMNSTEIGDGYFSNMDSKELMSHIAMAAIMTKSRGRWGVTGESFIGQRETSSQYMKNWEPYYNLMKGLNVEPKYLKEYLSTYDQHELARKVGGSLANHKTVQEMLEVVETITDQNLGTGSTGGYDPFSHKKAKLAIELRNLIEFSKDGKSENIKEIHQYTARELNKIEEALKLKEHKGLKFEEFSASELENRILIENGQSTFENFFKPMLKEMGEKAGLSVVETADGILEYTLGKETGAGHKGIAGEIEYALKKLANLDNSYVRIIYADGPTAKIKENAARTIKDKWVNRINEEFGFNYEINDLSDNIYMKQVKDAKTVAYEEGLLSIITGRHVDAENISLSDGIKSVLLTSEGKILSDFRNYNFGEAPSQKDVDAYAKFNARKNTLASIHSLMMLSGKYEHHNGTKVLELKDYNQVVKEWDTKAAIFESADMNMQEVMRNKFINRFMEYTETSEMSAATMVSAIENNLGIFDNGKFYLQTDKTFLEERRSFHGSDKDGMARAQKDLEKFQAIKRAIGQNKLNESDWMTIDQNKKASQDALNAVFEATLSSELSYMDTFAHKLLAGLESHGKFSEILMSKDGEEGLIATLRKLKDIKDRPEFSKEDVRILVEQARAEMSALKSIIERTNPNKKDGSPKESFNEFLDVVKETDTMLNKAYDKILKSTEGLKDKFGIEGVEQIQQGIQNVETLLILERESIAKFSEDIMGIVRNVKLGGGDQTSKRMMLEAMKTTLAEAMNEGGHNIKEAKNKTLKDIIETYNQEFSWTSARDLLSGLKSNAEVARFMNVMHGTFNTETNGDVFSRYMKQFMKHEGKATHLMSGKRMAELGIELMDPKNPNKLDPTFAFEMKNATVSELGGVLNKWVFDKINNRTDLKQSTKQKYIDEFHKEHLPVFLSSIDNAVTRKVLSINSGNVSLDLNAPARFTKNDQWIKDMGDGFDWIFLDNTIMLTKPDGKHKFARVHDLSHAEIEKLVNTQLPINETLADHVKSKASGRVAEDLNMKPENVKEIGDRVKGDYIYMRLSPQMHGVVVKNEATVKAIQDGFMNFYNKRMSMYDRKIDQLETKTNRSDKESELLTSYRAQRAALRDRWRDVANLTNVTDINHNTLTNKKLELMTLYAFSEYMNPGGMDKWMKELSQEKVNRENLASIEANMYKRLYLSDGGTSNMISNKWIDYVVENNIGQSIGLDSADILSFQKFNKSKKLNVGAFNDEAFKDRIESPFHGKRITQEYLEGIVKNEKLAEFAKEGAKEMLDMIKRGDIASLEAATTDGIIYIGHDLYRLLVHTTGGVKGESNGWKPVIAANKYDGLLGKGFLIYDPEIANQMNQARRGAEKRREDGTYEGPGGLDLLMPKSSIKEYRATQVRGKNWKKDINDKFSMVNFSDKSSKDWTSGIKDMNNNNSLVIDLSELRLGFQGKETHGVTLSNSMADFELRPYMEQLRKYQNYDNIFKVISELSTSFTDGRQDNLYRALLGEIERDGYSQTDPSASIATILVREANMSEGNPLISSKTEKMLLNNIMKGITRPFSPKGTDAFIIPDRDGILKPTIVKELTVKDGEAPLSGIVRFGEVSISHFLANRIAKDLTGISFIYENQGIDVIRQIKGKDLSESYSPIHDVYSKEGYGLGEKYKPKDKTIDDVAKKVINEIRFLASEYELNLADIFSLLKEGEVISRGQWTEFDQGTLTYDHARGEYVNDGIVRHSGDKGTGVRLSREAMNFVKKYDLALGASGMAIPLKGFDKSVHRVGEILSKDLGNMTKINMYDQRVIHQRDNDGDHFYLDMVKPLDMMKTDALKMYNVKDYYTFDKDTPTINMFGVSSTGIVGDTSLQPRIGASEYHNSLMQNYDTVGSVISARGALTYMNNLGFRVRVGEGKDKKYLPLVNSKFMDWDSRGKSLDRIMRTFQSAVDVHGGRAPIFNSSRDEMLRFLLFGDIPFKVAQSEKYNNDKKFAETLNQQVSEFADKFSIMNKEVFGLQEYSGEKANIIKEAVIETVRVLKRVNAIANGVYDDAGRKTPTKFDLIETRSSLGNFHRDPSRYLAQRIAKKIASSKVDPDKKANQYQALGDLFIDNFHTHQKSYTDIESAILSKITGKRQVSKDGKNLGPLDAFQFGDNIKNLNEFLDASQGGYLLRKIEGLSMFEGDSFSPESIKADKKVAAMSGALEAVNEINLRILLGKNGTEFNYRDFNVDAIYEADGMAVNEMTNLSKNNFDTRIAMAEKYGQHYSIMKIQRDHLRRSIDKNSGKYDMSMQIERLGELDNAIAVMEKALMKGSILLNDGANVKRVPGKNSGGKPFKTVKEDGKRKVVYRVHNNRIPKIEEGTVDFENINFKNVDYVTTTSGEKSKKIAYTMSEDYTYFEFKHPLIFESVSKTQAQEGFALFTAFGDAKFNSTQLYSDYGRSVDFLEAVSMLKSDLRDIFSRDMDMLKNDRALTRLSDSREIIVDRINDFLYEKGTALRDVVNETISADRGVDNASNIKWAAGMKSNFSDQALYHIMGAIMNPDVLQSKAVHLYQGNSVPAFRVDAKLMETMFSYLSQHGHLDVLKKLTADWESARGNKDPIIEARLDKMKLPYNKSGGYDPTLPENVRGMLDYLAPGHAEALRARELIPHSPGGDLKRVKGSDGTTKMIRQGKEPTKVEAGC